MVMSIQQAVGSAPAIATDHPHPYRGESFVHINTQEVLEVLLKDGFSIHQAFQARGRVTPRGVDTALYNPHVVRLRAPGYQDAERSKVGDVIPELLLKNAHDGSGCFQLILGLWRLICSNGMIVGDTMESIAIQHRWLSAEDIMEQARVMWKERVPLILAWREQALERRMSPEEATAFASRAQIIRFPDRAEMPFHPNELLAVRRPEDDQDDLWHIFNRVQENIMRGGIQGQSANGRATRTREITGVHSTVEINRSLWDIANRYLEAA